MEFWFLGLTALIVVTVIGGPATFDQWEFSNALFGGAVGLFVCAILKLVVL